MISRRKRVRGFKHLKSELASSTGAMPTPLGDRWRSVEELMQERNVCQDSIDQLKGVFYMGAAAFASAASTGDAVIAMEIELDIFVEAIVDEREEDIKARRG